MAMLRLCVLLLAGLLATAAAAQDRPEDLLRLGFLPPLGEDIVYRIDQHHEINYAGRQKINEWSHEVTIRLTAKEPPDLLVGTFSIGAVTPGPGVETDIAYTFAKAIEGETYALKMLELGAPVEIDWPAVRARIAERLPAVASPEAASVFKTVMPVFEPEGITAVLRPFWVTSVAYLRGFRRDGQVSVAEDLQLPAWFSVPKSRLEVHGGREENSEDFLFIWRLTADPEAAAQTLGPELVGLAAQAAGPEMKAEMEAAVARGVTAEEGGIATYDLTPGLMRGIEFEARLSAGEISRHVQITITRLKPE